MLRTGLVLDVRLLSHVGCKGCDPFPNSTGRSGLLKPTDTLHDLLQPVPVSSSHGTGWKPLRLFPRGHPNWDGRCCREWVPNLAEHCS